MFGLFQQLDIWWLLIIIFIIIIFIAVIIFFIFKSSKKKAGPILPSQAPPVMPNDLDSSFKINSPTQEDREANLDNLNNQKKEAQIQTKKSLQESFKDALKLLKTHVFGREYKYQIPWFLMIGQTSCGKTSMLKSSGLNISIDKPIKEPVFKNPCNWWFFEKGIVLDIDGSLVFKKFFKRKTDLVNFENLWKTFLRLLQKYRPERPLDGIILTIPCEDLILSENQQQDGHELGKISEQAQILYKKIWQIQNSLGMRLPIYIILTKCDKLEGFTSFCNKLPKNLQNNIFGWSSSYSIDTGYLSEWCEEAFNNINTNLLQMQFEIFASNENLNNFNYLDSNSDTDNDSLFSFPHVFNSIKNPLQIYLDSLFKQTLYHEAFIFRGIYFCGSQISSNQDSNNLNSKSLKESKFFFVKDLFEKKIFPEFGIAKPLVKSFVSKNRLVLATQIAALLIFIITSFGLWANYKTLSSDIKIMLPIFEEVKQDLNKLEHKMAESKQEGGTELYNMLRMRSLGISFEQSASNLFKGMANVKVLTFAFIPSSWFSDIHDKIQRALIAAYDGVILKAIYIQLLQKAKAIFEPIETNKNALKSSEEALNTEDMLEFMALKAFVENLKELEQYIDIYNNLYKSKDTDDFARIIKYAFGIDLPEGFTKNAQYYYNAAMSGTSYRIFDTKIFQIKAKMFTIKKLTSKLYEKLFNANVLFSYLQVLSVQLETFGQKKRNVTEDEKLIRDILDTISKTEALLAKSELAWISHKSFFDWKIFDDIFKVIEQSKFLGSSIAKDIETSGSKAFFDFKEKLKEKKTTLTGPILKRQAGEVVNMLSSDTLELKADLEKLLVQDFMVFEKTKDISFPQGNKITWDVSLLNEAILGFAPYEGFIQKGLKDFPAGLHGVVNRIVQGNMEEKTLGLLANARTVETRALTVSNAGIYEKEIASEIKNFKEASKILNRLLVYFDQLDLVNCHQVLSDALYHQSGRLLNIVESLLKESNLYNTKNISLSALSDLPEQTKFSLALFNISDDKELEFFLKIQRERIRYLAYEYAEPLVTFFSTNRILKGKKEEKILFKWELILKELEKYESKNADSSVLALEKFISFDLTETNPKNCLTKISNKKLNLESSDYFLQKKYEIERTLCYQCQQMSARAIMANYNQVKDFFNQKISGKFPFSISLVKSEKTGHYIEVDPETIRDFYQTFNDDYLDSLYDSLKRSPMFEASGERACEFIENIKNLKAIFAYIKIKDTQKDLKNKDLKDKKDEKSGQDGQQSQENQQSQQNQEETQIPAFDFEIEFRTNRELELEANRIIEWKFNSGSQIIKYGDIKTNGRWRFGDPVVVSFRWAKDSLDNPFYMGNQFGIYTDNKTIRYEFKNKWSLISLLKSYSAQDIDFERLSDTKQHNLKFEIDTKREIASKNKDKKEKEKIESKSRVFIKIVLSSPDKSKKEIKIPIFPDKAPILNIANTANK